jgi:hypothetical protein
MNETTNRMKRTATFFLTALLHALCVAACRHLLPQVGLAGGAAVGDQPFRTDNDLSAHKE